MYRSFISLNLFPLLLRVDFLDLYIDSLEKGEKKTEKERKRREKFKYELWQTVYW